MKNAPSTGTTRSLPPLPITRTRRSPMSTSASRSDRTSAARSPPSTINNMIARSRRCAGRRGTPRPPPAQRLRQPPRLADQPAAGARPARADMPEQAARLGAQPARTPRRRHRVVRPHTGHHRELEQAPHRGDPPVHRGRRRAPRRQPAAPPSARALAGALLPVQVVEQVRRHHVAQPGAAARPGTAGSSAGHRRRPAPSPARTPAPPDAPGTG